jgi:hypothetical protein
MELAATITSSRHDPCSTVLDERRKLDARGSAADLDGDVVGTNQITVPLESTVRAAELAARGLSNSVSASRTGRGGAALFHQPNMDAYPLGLVPQRLNQVGSAPLPQPEVLYTAHFPAGNPCEVPDHQGPDLVADSERDDLLGRLVLGLMDAAAMSCLGTAEPDSMTPPPAGAALPRPGCSACRLGLAGLLVLEMQVAFGADCPSRHQQPGVLGDNRVWMDDANVHPGDSALVPMVVVLDGDGGGDRQAKPPTIGQQGDRAADETAAPTAPADPWRPAAALAGRGC